VHRPVEAVAVADVADEPAQPGVVAEEVAALVLLQLVPGEDDDALGADGVQQVADDRLPERARPSGDEDGRISEDTNANSLVVDDVCAAARTVTPGQPC